ncbi:MAG: hypothetical protein ACRD0W_19845 [Acidimicrobiales bacterium]
MAVTRLPTASRDASVNAVVDRVDVGVTNLTGRVRVYTGAQPASANDAPTGTLLLEFNCENPAYGASSAGSAALDATPVLAAVGLAAGTAGWCRVVNRDVATVFDGDVTATGGGGVMQLSTTTVSVGLDVEITAGSYAQPAG